MKIQEEIISFSKDTFECGKTLFEETTSFKIYGEDICTIEAAKKRKRKNDDDNEDNVDDDDYYNNDDEDKDNPFDKEPGQNDLLDEDFPLEDEDDLFDDEDDIYN
ncbi:MAG: hypothetical protein KJN64_02095 [Ignavibacteria bacterium]|nr:hypothetical protein [Ignavibacteria bacterium]MBT8381506.1 hypothetical protein [Ignavibacteria bacterium]MBT8391568.1 hypothetical protein [Ignavibacteria bacterium]NNJ52261.1 hypothetical protein [Ignavibacteriaceae bacterium]NNL22737.1 hypothetical protein [Ignavibacteriaceae bacterium]